MPHLWIKIITLLSFLVVHQQNSQMKYSIIFCYRFGISKMINIFFLFSRLSFPSFFLINLYKFWTFSNPHFMTPRIPCFAFVCDYGCVCWKNTLNCLLCVILKKILQSYSPSFSNYENSLFCSFLLSFISTLCVVALVVVNSTSNKLQ